MKVIRFIALLLMVIGSLNWGLMGFFHYNLVADLLGPDSMATRVIYALVGLAGLYGLGLLCKCVGCACRCGPNCNCCHKKD